MNCYSTISDTQPIITRLWDFHIHVKMKSLSSTDQEKDLKFEVTRKSDLKTAGNRISEEAFSVMGRKLFRDQYALWIPWWLKC